MPKSIGGIPTVVLLGVGVVAFFVLRKPKSCYGCGQTANPQAYAWDPVTDPNSQYFSPWQSTPGMP